MFLPLFDRYRTVKLLILLGFNLILGDSRVANFLPVSGQESSKLTLCHSPVHEFTPEKPNLGCFNDLKTYKISYA